MGRKFAFAFLPSLLLAISLCVLFSPSSFSDSSSPTPTPSSPASSPLPTIVLVTRTLWPREFFPSLSWSTTDILSFKSGTTTTLFVLKENGEFTVSLVPAIVQSEQWEWLDMGNGYWMGSEPPLTIIKVDGTQVTLVYTGDIPFDAPCTSDGQHVYCGEARFSYNPLTGLVVETTTVPFTGSFYNNGDIVWYRGKGCATYSEFGQDFVCTAEWGGDWTCVPWGRNSQKAYTVPSSDSDSGPGRVLQYSRMCKHVATDGERCYVARYWPRVDIGVYSITAPQVISDVFKPPIYPECLAAADGLLVVQGAGKSNNMVIYRPPDFSTPILSQTVNLIGVMSLRATTRVVESTGWGGSAIYYVDSGRLVFVPEYFFFETGNDRMVVIGPHYGIAAVLVMDPERPWLSLSSVPPYEMDSSCRPLPWVGNTAFEYCYQSQVIREYVWEGTEVRLTRVLSLPEWYTGRIANIAGRKGDYLYVQSGWYPPRLMVIDTSTNPVRMYGPFYTGVTGYKQSGDDLWGHTVSEVVRISLASPITPEMVMRHFVTDTYPFEVKGVYPVPSVGALSGYESRGRAAMFPFLLSPDGRVRWKKDYRIWVMCLYEKKGLAWIRDYGFGGERVMRLSDGQIGNAFNTVGSIRCVSDNFVASYRTGYNVVLEASFLWPAYDYRVFLPVVFNNGGGE